MASINEVIGCCPLDCQDACGGWVAGVEHGHVIVASHGYVYPQRMFYRRMLASSGGLARRPSERGGGIVRSLESAYRLLRSPEGAAFDLSREPEEIYRQYDTGRFGLGCLLARRLTEAGARFIEVTTEYVPFESWDTHENGHTTTAAMKQQIDRPVARLVLDLEERGLLDRTLVVLASEFSRDMVTEGRPGSSARDQSRAPADVMQEMRHYGLHRHFTLNGSVLLFGGGIGKGRVYGETADERPCVVTRDPVTVTDLHATILSALGISPRASFDIERRPFYVTEDGKGRPVDALFA